MPISGAPVDISVIGVTGEYRSGKSLFLLTIAPGVHPAGHKFAGKPRTRVYDVEKSCSTYQGTGAEIINVIEEVQKNLVDPNTKTVKTPTDVDIYRWLIADLEKVQPGQFDVIAVDPITDFDSGLATFIRQNPTKFGLTVNQIVSGGGLMWGALKSYWKIILSTLASRCQSFAYSAHLRDEFLGAVPTGKREPKGKDTLMELASLYLWMERRAKIDGSVPEEPSAIVMKERLSDTVMQEDGTIKIIKLIPPRIPVATPQAIREYIANPPDYSKLKDDEKYVEQPMTDDERLAMKAMIATKEAEASSNSLAAIDGQARIVAMQQKILASSAQTSDRTAELQAAQAEKRDASAVDSIISEALTPEPEVVNEAPVLETSEPAKTKPTNAKQAEPAPAATPSEPLAPGLVEPDNLKKLQTLLFAIKWPDVEGKTTQEFIQDFLIRAEVPQEDGKMKPRKMSNELCLKLIEVTTKKLIKQGVDPAELLGK
jgi:hypothetical protein